jgi:hypothetical protein
MKGQYPAVPHAARDRAEKRDGIFLMDEDVSCDHAVEGAGAFKGVERGFLEDDVVEARALRSSTRIETSPAPAIDSKIGDERRATVKATD